MVFDDVLAVALTPWGLLVLGLVIGSFLNVVIHRLPLISEADWKVDALDSVGGGPGNADFTEAPEQIQRDVSTGPSLTVAMQTTNIFPVMVLQMTSIGEESGALDGMLLKTADTFDQETSQAMDRMLAALVPIVTLVLAAVVGVVIIAVLVPLYDLTNSIG